jgi:hypothetical protein
VTSSARLLRWLCWSLVVLAVVAAVLTLMISFNVFVPPPPGQISDLVDRIAAFRIADQQIFPYVFVQTVATAGVFLIAAMLGTVLRGWALPSSSRDLMTLTFVLGGVLGIAANLINIALANAATFGYCDCGYKTQELISQDYALSVGYNIVNWLSIGAVLLTAAGIALAGRLINVSSAWRTLAYLIVVVVVLAVIVRIVSAFVFISAFDPGQISDLLTALALAVLVPIWAVMLARSADRSSAMVEEQAAAV